MATFTSLYLHIKQENNKKQVLLGLLSDSLPQSEMGVGWEEEATEKPEEPRGFVGSPLIGKLPIELATQPDII